MPLNIVVKNVDNEMSSSAPSPLAKIENFTLQDGVPPDNIPSALQLFWQAFERKLKIPLGPPEKGQEFLRHSMGDRSIVSAIRKDGKLLGVATYKSYRPNSLTQDLKHLFATYGKVSGLFRGLLLSQLDQQPATDEMMVESICVDEKARSHGIGHALLGYIKEQATRQGMKRITLDVITKNERAHRLYSRLGYRDIRHHSVGLLSPIFGFKESIRMGLSLTQ